MRSLKAQLLTCLCLCLCLLAAPAQAQFGGKRGLGGSRGNTGGSGPRAEGGFAAPNSRLNQFTDQLMALRLQLQLEAVQEAAWNDFQHRAVDWAAEALRGRYASTEEAALQALERRWNEARRRQGLLEALLASARQLESQLNPDQRRTLDLQLPALLP